MIIWSRLHTVPSLHTFHPVPSYIRGLSLLRPPSVKALDDPPPGGPVRPSGTLDSKWVRLQSHGCLFCSPTTKYHTTFRVSRGGTELPCLTRELSSKTGHD